MEENTTHNILKRLLDNYLADPGNLSEISGSTEIDEQRTVSEIHEQGAFLVKKGFVKHASFHTTGFNCSITTLGILQVSSVFSDLSFKVLQAAIEQKKKSLSDILGIEPGHFRKAHDFGTYLKKLGMIECIFHPNDVFAEPTFYGKEWYQEQKLKLNT